MTSLVRQPCQNLVMEEQNRNINRSHPYTHHGTRWEMSRQKTYMGGAYPVVGPRLVWDKVEAWVMSSCGFVASPPFGFVSISICLCWWEDYDDLGFYAATDERIVESSDLALGEKSQASPCVQHQSGCITNAPCG
jgi:hypothetical protein